MSKTKDHLQDLISLYCNALHSRITCTASELLATAMDLMDHPAASQPENIGGYLCWAEQQRNGLVQMFQKFPEHIRPYVVTQYLDFPDLTLEQALWQEVGDAMRATIAEYDIAVHPDAATLLDMTLELPGNVVGGGNTVYVPNNPGEREGV